MLRVLVLDDEPFCLSLLLGMASQLLSVLTLMKSLTRLMLLSPRRICHPSTSDRVDRAGCIRKRRCIRRPSGVKKPTGNILNCYG